MKQRKTISSFLTSRFLMIVRDEENYEEKGTFSYTYAKLIVICGVFLLAIISIAFVLSTTVLANYFDPRFEQMMADKKLIELESRVDSLNEQVQIKQKYIESIKRILSGQDDVGPHENGNEGESEFRSGSVDLEHIHPIDSQFRQEFEGVELGGSGHRSSTKDVLQHYFFFNPVGNGVISDKFNLKKRHYGIDVVAQKNEPIKAIADGTVVLSAWTQETGNVIAIQHKNQLISFYKHNSVLLKKIGDLVRAGDIIAIIGNSGELTDGAHLHLELWYDGSPVNPEDFIFFN